jgi:hypothetical protein
MGKMGNAYEGLFGKLEGKRPLWKIKQKWEDIIKMDRT